jgi:SAM-dependent methyltransferase
MPFPAHSFQVVCCQAGLQFFPDRPAALAEMARVLVPGGRLAALVWRSIDHSPGFAALADALDRHIGPAAGAIMRAPFGLGDDPSLRDLLTGAGFRDVRLDRQSGTVRFGSARELVTAQVAGSPLAGPVGAAGPAARAALLAGAEATLERWREPTRLAFPIGALLISARR